jgi:hypothetical protein
MFRHRFSAEKSATPEFRKFLNAIKTSVQQFVQDADLIEDDVKKFRSEMLKAGFDAKDPAFAIPMDISESLYKEMVRLDKEVMKELEKAYKDYEAKTK